MRSDFVVTLLCFGLFTLMLNIVLESLPGCLQGILRPKQRKGRLGEHGDFDDSFFFIVETWRQACVSYMEACAVESAARHHPAAQVVLFLAGFAPDRGDSRTLHCQPMKALRSIANVRISHLDLADLVTRTPLRHWRADIRRGNGAATLGSAARFALLWKHGGVYADLDVVVRRPVLGKLRNCVGERGGEARDPPFVSGAVLVFDKGHSLMKLCMEEMERQRHDSRLLVMSASEVIARTLRDHYVCRRHESTEFAPARELRCADGRSRVTVMPREAFVADEERNSTPPYRSATRVRGASHGGARSYVARHVWPMFGLSARQDRAQTGWASRAEADVNCPRVYRWMKLDERLV